jgi:hypothetical protein
VLEQPVYARVADDPEQVQVRPFRQRIRHRGVQLDVVVERSVADRLGDRDRLLVHNPPRPNVLVPDLAVAHRPLGEPDVEPAGVDEHIRILRQQPVGHGVLPQENRVGLVPLRIWIPAPPVTDNEHDRTLGDSYGGRHGSFR